MKFLNIFIITFISVLLFACGDSRGADKEELAAKLSESQPGATEEQLSCMADFVSDALNDDEWAFMMFGVRGDTDGQAKFAEDNELDVDAIAKKGTTAGMSAAGECITES